MDKTFLGMTVEGAGGVGEQSYRAVQYSREQFEEALQTVLRHDRVTGVAWNQYTPYWNDGEPCTFRVGEVVFSFTDTELNEDEKTYWDYRWHEDDYEETGRVWCGQWSQGDVFDRIVGNDKKNWGPWKTSGPRDWTWAEDSGPANAPDPQLFTDIHEFIRLMDGGHFENVVEDLFGDHAIIRIDKINGKVIIDEYDHD